MKTPRQAIVSPSDGEITGFLVPAPEAAAIRVGQFVQFFKKGIRMMLDSKNFNSSELRLALFFLLEMEKNSGRVEFSPKNIEGAVGLKKTAIYDSRARLLKSGFLLARQGALFVNSEFAFLGSHEKLAEARAGGHLKIVK